MLKIKDYPFLEGWGGIAVNNVIVDVVHGSERTALANLGCTFEDDQQRSDGRNSWTKQRIMFPKGTRFVSYTKNIDVDKFHVYIIGDVLFEFKRRRFDGALMNVFGYAEPSDIEGLRRNLRAR